MTNANGLDVSRSPLVANNSKSTQTIDSDNRSPLVANISRSTQTIPRDNTSNVTKDTRPQQYTIYPPTTERFAGQFQCSDLPPQLKLLDRVRDAAKDDPFYQAMVNAVDKRWAIYAQLEQAKLQGKTGMVEGTREAHPDNNKGNMEYSKETFEGQIQRVMADLKKNRQES